MPTELTPPRAEKLRIAIRRTQPDITIILENVHDPLNINAVLRTADAVGIRQVWALDSEPGLARQDFKLGKRSSGGVYKYVEVRLFHDPVACLAEARARFGGEIWAAHLAENYELSHFTKKTEAVNRAVEKLQNADQKSIEKPTRSLFELDLTQPITLIFGNEHFGPTPATLAACDGFFAIPMVGLAQSLNVSVSAAVTFYEAFRQRALLGFYAENPPLDDDAQVVFFKKWEKMLLERDDKRIVEFGG